MVRIRWTFFLFIITFTLLVSVISAFRIRDLHKISHESDSVFKKREKCEDCDVNKLDLEQKLHKTESVKRAYDDLKKSAQEKKQSIDEKTLERIKPALKINAVSDEDEDNDESDDETNENLIYLRKLASKWEEKQKATGVINEIKGKQSSDKKQFTTSNSKDITQDRSKKFNMKNDNDDDDDDDDEDDDDGVDNLKTTVALKKKTTTKIRNKQNDNDQDDSDDDNSEDDNDHHDVVDDTNDNSDDNSKIIDDIESSNEKMLKTLTKPIKSDTDKILKKQNILNSKSGSKENKAEDVLNAKAIKINEAFDKTGQHRVSNNDKKVKDEEINKLNESLVIKSKNKHTTEDIINKKEISDTTKDNKKVVTKKLKETIKIVKPEPQVENIKINEELKTEAPLKEIKKEGYKTESQDENRLKHVTDAFHRRNLLKSEFEDFYAFLPTFGPNFTRVKNPECRRHGQILLRQLRGSKLWALNMLDATGKVPSGILQGNGIQLGSFDQCLESRARVQLDTGSVVKLQGKYCLARVDLKAEHPEMEIPVHLAQAKSLIKSRVDDPGHFVPRFSSLSWGVCVPSPCNAEDVENILRDAIKHYQYTSGVSIRVKVDSIDCHTQRKQLWWEQWLTLPTLLTLSLYGVVILLVLAATAQDFVARRKEGERTADAKHEMEQKDTKDDKNNENEKQSDGESIISVFSLYRTISKLIAPADADEISCIHGVRAIATVALLVAHKILPVGVMPYTNRVKISEVVSSPLWSWCRAGWMYTDCFLLLSGTLTAHRITNDNESGPFKRILSRYIRLTPALIAVILFYAYVWDNVSVGPMWGTLVTKNAEVCQQGWWWNTLYVQNYFGFENMCAPQTHQLALDMQLSILGGVVVWCMQSDMPMLRALLPTLHVWTAFSRYRTAREHRLTMLAYHGVSVSQLYRTARLSYTSVIHRSTPYLVGLSLGLALKSNARHSKIVIAFGWLLGIVLWCLVWWAGYDSGSTQYRYSVTFAAQYAALAPISSALAIAWLIYAVHSGHCDFLNNLLCSRPLAFISRLSYALYLCQFVVFLTNAATVKTSREFSLMSMIDVQEISWILLSSVVLTLTFVIPMQSLPKIILLTSKYNNKGNKITDTDVPDKIQQQTESPRRNERVLEAPLIRNRQTLIAHREVLEEIPEVEMEYEQQKEIEGLEEILEEEEDDETLDNERERLNEDDLEVIEEEQGGEEDFWMREELAQRRSFSRNSDREMDDWEMTGNDNGRSGAQHYRYSRER